jgi:hypothetical protein
MVVVPLREGIERLDMFWAPCSNGVGLFCMMLNGLVTPVRTAQTDQRRPCLTCASQIWVNVRYVTGPLAFSRLLCEQLEQ